MKQLRAVAGPAALALASILSGCILIAPKRTFVDKKDVLDAVAEASGYRPDPSRYRMRHADVYPDLITFHYQGAVHPGDRAWVICFSQKSTEQRPEELVKLDALLATIAEGKDGFQVLERGRRDLHGVDVIFARYHFLSPLRDSKGQPVRAGGVAAVTRLERGPAPVIYHLNADNIEGDRPDLGWPELEPLAAAIKR
jgi:hypothetical protein